MKTLVIRLALLAALILIPSGLLAQEVAPDTEATIEQSPAIASEGTPVAQAPEASANSYETRREFGALLRQSPPELATILALDSTLLSNEAFLEGYPALSRFVAAHPEVRHNPRFYFADVHIPGQYQSSLDGILEGIAVFSVFLLIALALGWLVRTVIEQKRWNRLSRTQTEVHNKIMDRFGSSEELLEYIRTPAGARFLESAPIPLHAQQETLSAPLTRIMWSIQIGVVVAAGALGMLLVSRSLEAESAEGLFALGAIALCVGAGFVGSAFVSLFLSRRLGLWQPTQSSDAPSQSSL